MRAIRLGGFLFNYHPGHGSIIPSLSLYQRGWWSFLWMGIEISYASTETI